MDWSKTKTIFIFAFLVLDLFLVWQYSQLVITNKYKNIQDASVTDQFKEEAITYPPLDDTPDLPPLKAERHLFTDEERSSLKEQEPAFKEQDPYRLAMKLVEPVKVDKDDLAKADTFVSAQLISGSEYVLWSYNRENSTITYFQRVNDRIVYQKSGDKQLGSIVLHLNENREIISYEQTYMDTADEEEQPQDTATALEALARLYNENDLKPKSEVTEMTLGYYTSQGQDIASQSLQPHWYVEINNKDFYFVNAYDTQVVRPNQQKKLE
ncbi:hypothetical protein GKZ89_11990 [Bacillus mangrovi]|uniref:Regulatory protein YycH-like domain-containing protein n=1 Tax=Metabacillus mangrovi TaxID=1491830 RepID=A0A7X2S6F6_9BACI|nr:two-component system regulatory protein YycI [Metabacillus mangrovi]MTH54128.1 hypothetical protein [Metabacillus mangrovi]